MNHIISEEFRKRILAYLYTRPYQEVAILIAHLSQLKPADSKDKNESAKKPQ